jgi:RNA-directed DNA polymerase
MKEEKQMYENKKSCASSDHNGQTWESIDWNKCEQMVNKLQARIVKAQKAGKYGRVKTLQWILTHSFYAKALAVKRVTSNNGKKTSGVDKVLWSTPQSKLKAIVTLKRRGYKPQPLKRVNIKKSNGKLRPLGIPTMKDRAMQALYLMALEPVSETTADNYSFGFRKDRSTADAMARCHALLSRKSAAQWVLEGDIKGCFDHISHNWLMENIPMDKSMLQKWLKCGFIYKNELFPTDEGTPQGGIISPTLANMTLDGLQELLETNFPWERVPGKWGWYCPKVRLVRYADDFIITGDTKELLEQKVKPLVTQFLAERGLTLSEEKTKITHISEGFDFLGFNVRKFGDTLLTQPAKDRIKRMLAKIKYEIKRFRGDAQHELIMRLNPILNGWANYYKHSAASNVFRKADHQIYEKLWRWALRRHGNKCKGWIKNRYFHRINGRDWVFAIKKKNEKKEEYYIPITLLFNTKIVTYPQLKCEVNPFDPDWRQYLEKRRTTKMKMSLKGKRSLISMWERQKRNCVLCDQPITAETTWHTMEQQKNGRNHLCLAHENCYNSVTHKKKK